MHKFFTQMLKDSRGGASHKRLITVVAAFLLFGSYAVNLFYPLHIEEYMWTTLRWIVLGGMGISTSEYFGSGSSLPAHPGKGGSPAAYNAYTQGLYQQPMTFGQQPIVSQPVVQPFVQPVVADDSTMPPPSK